MPKNNKLHPKQTLAFKTRGNEILYGGAAGGGKSHLMRIAMLWWCCHVPGLQCYLFRRVSEDLVKNHVEGTSGFRALLTEFIESGHVRFNDQKGTIGFWNGSKIFLCHCQYEKDRFKYQGAEMHVLCCEEHEPVRMADGSLARVKDLRVGDSVMTLAGGRTVTSIGKRRLDRCVNATVFDGVGDVVGTQIHSETHKVLTPEGWVSYADMCGGPRQPLTCESTGCCAGNKSVQQFGTKYPSGSPFHDTQDQDFGRTVSQDQSLRGHQCLSEICAYTEQRYRGNCSELFECERQEKQPPFSAFRFPVVLYSPDQPLGATGSIGDEYACAQSECIREDFLSRCDSSRGQCGESVLHRSDNAPNTAQQQACVETQNQRCQPWGDSGKARERIRLDGLSYEHPYTGEELLAEEPVEFGSCEMSPCGDKWVIDLTVADENHYITKSRLVNKNCIDELTHFTDTIYRYLRGRVRVGELEVPAEFDGVFPRIICGSNPGGVGHNWVKAAWIDLAPPMAITQMPEDEGGMLRQYIPAKLEDNPTLIKKDPHYLARLSGLGNAALVRAMRDGDWDIVAGGALDDVWDRTRHVVAPFEIPTSWMIDRSFDWGSSKPFSVGWWAESDGTEATLRDGTKKTWPKGTVFRIAEYYGWSGRPNEGCKLLAVEVARKIKDIEHHIFPKRSVTPGPADPAIFAAENGVCIADDMARAGVRWVPADNRPGSRASGLEAIRRMLKASLAFPMEEPGLFVFDTCTHFIRTVPVLPRDERKTDDVDSDAEDHCLSGETLVDTPCGQVKIKDLVGKQGAIFTAGGFVSWFHSCRKTKKSAKTVEVCFADGRVVTCTPEHRFLTKKNGWVEAKSLQINTDIVTVSHLNKGGEKCKSRLSATGLRILMGSGIISAGGIFKEEGRGFTAQFTNSTMEKLKKAFMCTTSTAIGRTTRLKIYRSLLAASTRLRTQKTRIAGNGKRLCGKALLGGMEAPRAAHGTQNSMKSTARLRCQRRLKSPASSAGQASRGQQVKQGFVRTSAGPQAAAHLGLTRSQNNVQFAGVRSRETSTQSLKLALRLVAERSTSVAVVSIIQSKNEDVYCLDVVGWHAFSVAGGIVVHNCYDESRYRLMRRKSSTTVSPISIR